MWIPECAYAQVCVCVCVCVPSQPQFWMLFVVVGFGVVWHRL